jgi:hypothetical protein
MVKILFTKVADLTMAPVGYDPRIAPANSASKKKRTRKDSSSDDDAE